MLLGAAESASDTSSGTSESAVSLWEGLRGLSLALDLAMGRHKGHAQAVAALSVRVGRWFGLTNAELSDLALAGLLKDSGCPSTRPAFANEVGLDDIAFHRASFALAEYTPRSFAALLWTLHQAQTDRLTTRVFGWTRSLLGFRRYAVDYQRAAKRSNEAVRIAAQLECPISTLAALASVGEHWDGSGSPGSLNRDQIPLASRIIAVCQIALIWGETAAPAAVAARLLRLPPGRFDPQVLREVARTLQGLTVGPPPSWIDELARECWAHAFIAGRDRPLDAQLLASTFAELVDMKSSFTGSHSLRVASLAGAMAALDRQTLTAGVTASAVILAALLHDLGKLAVPTTILDKQGPLTPQETALLRRHPADSAQIIGAITPWASLANWAGAHHERIDGRGYHQGLAGDAIPPIGRLLAVADAFDAMIADRPYRKGIAPEEALRRVRDERGTQFDPIAAELLETVVAQRKTTLPGPALRHQS